MVLCSLARVRTAFPLMIAAAEGACGQALILRVGLHQAAHLKLAWRSVVWGQLPASLYQLAFAQQMLANAVQTLALAERPYGESRRHQQLALLLVDCARRAQADRLRCERLLTCALA